MNHGADVDDEPGAGRRELVDELRRLAAHLATTDVDDAAAAALAVAVRDFRARGGHPRRRRWIDVSPYQGRLNVAAPPMTLTREPGAAGGHCLVGTVTLDRRFEGPPGATHGGVVAGLFDEVLGAVPASLTGTSTVTGRLVVRYRLLTPLHAPLRITGWIDHDRGHRVVVRGDCRADGEVTAEAQGLFIRVDR